MQSGGIGGNVGASPRTSVATTNTGGGKPTTKEDDVLVKSMSPTPTNKGAISSKTIA